MPQPVIDVAGKRFGKLLVIERAGASLPCGKVLWRCHCDCGNTDYAVDSSRLKRGKTKSCGCEQGKQPFGHGRAGHQLYNIWRGIKHRCHNPKATGFKYYGGRGIVVCQRWLDSIENFIADMLPTFKPGLEIDRIDNDGNYEPSNCRWVTHAKQMSNTRRGTRFTINGVAKKLPEWCREYGINYNTARDRVRRGWPPERAVLNANS